MQGTFPYCIRNIIERLLYFYLTNVFMQEVLYCAKKAGVTHILKAGGAQV